MNHEPLPTLHVHIARTIFTVFPVMIVMALLLTALEFFFPDSSASGIVVSIFIAYLLHRFVLFQPANWLRPKDGQKNGQAMPPDYVLRFMGASMIPVALALVVSLPVAVSFHDKVSQDELVGFVFLIVAAVTWVYLSLFGAQLPAMAAG